MTDVAIDKHDNGGNEVQQKEPALTFLSRITDRLVAANESDDAENKENSCNPEVCILKPNRFGRRFLLGHKVILPFFKLGFGELGVRDGVGSVLSEVNSAGHEDGNLTFVN